MAVTKIHPIKTTLKKAVSYIANGDKTEDSLYVSSYMCSVENADSEFELTKKEFASRTKTKAHHLIQSFSPGEVSPELAHQVGIELADAILGSKHEYIIATHTDKDHVHNHIIFNSVDFEKGKLYHSYYGSYMRIRSESDRLCKVHHLSVIDEDIEKTIKAIKRRKFKNWYDWHEDKKGSSYKSRLQRIIDKNIGRASDWEAFLKRMTDDGYEIKRGKHIAFKQKHQKRFTRARTIGSDYTEESIKKRIHKESVNVYEPIDSIVDIDNNAKIKNSKAYFHWATKHNLETMSKSMLLLRKEGFKSITELNASIQSLSFKLSEQRKVFEQQKFKQKRIAEITDDLKTMLLKKSHYEGYLKNPDDKIYKLMNGKDVEAYKASRENVDIFLKQFPELKAMINLNQLDKGVFKRLNKHTKEMASRQRGQVERYNQTLERYNRLVKIKSNYDAYLKRGDDEKKPSIITQIKKNKAQMKRGSENEKFKNKDLQR